MFLFGHLYKIANLKFYISIFIFYLKIIFIYKNVPNGQKRKDEERMKRAFLFPGQGAQVVGMGKDIYEKYDEAKKSMMRLQEYLELM